MCVSTNLKRVMPRELVFFGISMGVVPPPPPFLLFNFFIELNIPPTKTPHSKFMYFHHNTHEAELNITLMFIIIDTPNCFMIRLCKVGFENISYFFVVRYGGIVHRHNL